MCPTSKTFLWAPSVVLSVFIQKYDEDYNLDKILNHYLVFIPATLE